MQCLQIRHDPLSYKSSDKICYQDLVEKSGERWVIWRFRVVLTLKVIVMDEYTVDVRYIFDMIDPFPSPSSLHALAPRTAQREHGALARGGRPNLHETGWNAIALSFAI